MNIQIFGTNKSQDTRKAQRYFKERGIRFQFIDLTQKYMSRGEFNSVLSSVGGAEKLIDRRSRAADLVTLFDYSIDEDKEALLFENQDILMLLPVVRNGKSAAVGNSPDVWSGWLA